MRKLPKANKLELRGPVLSGSVGEIWLSPDGKVILYHSPCQGFYLLEDHDTIGSPCPACNRKQRRD